jgi:DNA-binding response OmpR family regulator
MICAARQDTEDELALLRRDSWVPVILLTDDGAPDLAALLDLGADDVISKPFSPREVVARARATMRRAAGPPPSGHIVRGDLEIDLRGRRVRVSGRLVELARREYDLLAFLAGHPGQVFSRGQLLQHVWGAEEGWQSAATVTEHVRRLRSRIGPAPDGAERIETVRSIGYRFRT